MDFFGINTIDNLNHADFPTFEEVLGILEISLNRYESFKNYPLIPQDPKVQKIREQIIFLIARTLKDKLRDGRPNHDALISRMKRPQLRTTAFVSLNYDILIDNALTEKNDLIDLDYGIQFTNFDKKGDWHKPHVNRTTKLFKLHGSLNWLYCPTCISLTITPKEKSVAALYHSTIADTPINCQCCQTKMIPIIIPPTFSRLCRTIFYNKSGVKQKKCLWKQKESSFVATRFLMQMFTSNTFSRGLKLIGEQPQKSISSITILENPGRSNNKRRKDMKGSSQKNEKSTTSTNHSRTFATMG